MRPSFILTKAERRAERSDNFFSIMERYKEIYCQIFEWDALEAPKGFIESALFDLGAVGVNKTSSVGNIISGARPILRDYYGRALTWNPVMPAGVGVDPTILEEQESRILDLGLPMYERIEAYVDVMAKAYDALRMNVSALQQPVMLDASKISQIGGKIQEIELERGRGYIPALEGGGNVSVLDLKAVDHTQNLISTINAMDAEILTLMGIRNVGTEKMSGITTAETVSLTQQLTLYIEYERSFREEFAAANGFTVTLSSGYKVDNLPVPTQVVI